MLLGGVVQEDGAVGGLEGVDGGVGGWDVEGVRTISSQPRRNFKVMAIHTWYAGILGDTELSDASIEMLRAHFEFESLRLTSDGVNSAAWSTLRD